MQSIARKRGSLAVLAAVLVACATSACQPTDDQSSGGPSGETTVSIVIPHIRIANDKCHTTGANHKVNVKVSGLRRSKKYHLYVYPTSADKKTPPNALHAMSGTADKYGNGSYVISCERKEGYAKGFSYALILAQDGIDETDKAVFRVLP